MASTKTHIPAEPGHWFLRGLQSAVFFYVSCQPCLEFQHKRKRRREAKAAAAIITTQPGIIPRPGPFQTNETWAEELMLGPGPPKGWKGDKLLVKLQKQASKQAQDTEAGSPEMSRVRSVLSSCRPSTQSRRPSTQPTEPSTRPSSSDRGTLSTDHAGPSDQKPSASAGPKRPVRERSLSNAMENAMGNIKDSLRQTLHPKGWNWKRYDREDEILAGFRRMWNRATSSGQDEPIMIEGQEREFSSHGRKRATTNDSDRYDYYRRARNPEVNELHPPIVSKLPATREEAAWMLLPPPSAAVMAGLKHPGEETEMRRPMCVIGRPPKQPTPKPKPKPPVAMTLSSEDFDDIELDSSGWQDSSLGDEHPRYRSDENDGYFDSSTLSRSRPKHLSDPIVQPPPAHTRPSLGDDLFVPKRRDSWQFHYVIPSNPSISS